MTQQKRERQLYRNPERGQIAGVCAGLAEYFGVDAALVRILFVVLTFTGGPGLIAYLILWLALPERDEPMTMVEN